MGDPYEDLYEPTIRISSTKDSLINDSIEVEALIRRMVRDDRHFTVFFEYDVVNDEASIIIRDVCDADLAEVAQ